MPKKEEPRVPLVAHRGCQHWRGESAAALRDGGARDDGGRREHSKRQSGTASPHTLLSHSCTRLPWAMQYTARPLDTAGGLRLERKAIENNNKTLDSGEEIF